jgi:hypothetical protein
MKGPGTRTLFTTRVRRRQRRAAHRRTRRTRGRVVTEGGDEHGGARRASYVRALASRTGSNAGDLTRWRPLDRLQRVRQTASKVALPDATEWAFRSRTRPPSSPATTRRASANAPQRGRSAIAGGDDHAGAKRATAIAVLFGERATTRGRGATANGDERGGARRALSVRVPALWSRRRRAARRTGRALRVRTPRLRRQPRCAAHRRTPGTRALLKLKSGRTGWVEMDLAQIPGGVHLPYWSVTLPNHRAHRQIRDR